MSEVSTAADAPTYTDENSAKAEFDDLYTAPTPHAYLRGMLDSGYAICEETRPYFTAAVEYLREQDGPGLPVQMLDVGCSYGIGAALVRFGCTFPELTAYFAGRAPEEYRRCVESTRMWLNATPPRGDLRVIGLDTSRPALRFAREAGLIQGAIASNFELPEVSPSAEEVAWLRSCNLLVSSGAIGYVTERTLDKLLPELGRDHPSRSGPLAVFSVLRMFDPAPLLAAFQARDWEMRRVPGVLLPQRRFVDEREREGILSLLTARGLDTAGREAEGVLYADLFVAAPGAHTDPLIQRMLEVARGQPGEPTG